MSPRLHPDIQPFMCGMKKAFKTRALAERSLETLRRHRTGISKNHRPYQCPFCHLYHFGTMGKTI